MDTLKAMACAFLRGMRFDFRDPLDPSVRHQPWCPLGQELAVNPSHFTEAPGAHEC